LRFTLRIPGLARDHTDPSPADTLEALTNWHRASYFLPPYRRSATLDAAAQMRTDDMAARNYFGHDTPEGTKGYTTALASLGVSYAWAGENLALNNWPRETSAQEAIRGLMASPLHRANILEAHDFDAIGIGYSEGNGFRYFAQIFLGGGNV
jgi:uncharacterized protein YkwD